MREMYNQIFRYVRMTAKLVSLLFVLACVFLFIVQFLPAYIGRGIWLCIFIAGGIIWAVDTPWSTCDDVREIVGEIKDHRRLNRR